MSTTLTDRYIAVTLHRVPGKQRPEIERELRAAIADDVDARVELGEAPSAAEYAAVKELGNPSLLATRYSGRSGALIGPQVYPSYIGTLRTLCWLVLPILAVVLITAARASGANAWASIFPPLGSVLTVAMYIVVVVTVLFAAVDRAGATATAARGADAWTPELLPEPAAPQPTSVGETIAKAVVGAAIIAALFVQRSVSAVHDGSGAAVPILTPALWHFWLPYFIALIVLAVAHVVVKLWLGRQTRMTAIVDVVIMYAGAIPLAVLFWQARLVNPALANTPSTLGAPASWISWLAVLIIALVTSGRLVLLWQLLTKGTDR
ncbi:MAG TPA: permease prefix domain 1-containing protein [Pseudonocardiaceae bacterium]|jgi:hypothetical protein|nr:permease prefix domain 1-containing protein [Pseudonocardiaceae bacterium]